MGQFDQAARYTAKLDPAAFLRWLLPGLDATLTFQGWLDARTLPFPGEPDRTCDTVAELLDPARLDRLWALIVEFQSEPDPEILDRLLEYMVRLWREVRHGPDHRMQYLTAACLLNLTGPAQTDELDMALPCADEVRLRFRPRVRTLRDDDAAATLRDIDMGNFGRCILPWIPLMHGGGDVGTIEEWKRVAGLEPDGRLRSVYAALALVFAELAGRRVEWKQALEGWNMRQSMVITEWQDEAREEGRREAQRTDLRRVLQTRFFVPVPDDLAAAIETVADSEELARWLDIALTAVSLDAFRAAIQK
jgi:hypothetical protein